MATDSQTAPTDKASVADSAVTRKANAATDPRSKWRASVGDVLDKVASIGVQSVLFGLTLGTGWLLYKGVLLPVLGSTPTWLETLYFTKYVSDRPAPALSQVALAVAVVGLCLLPKVLTFCIVSLIQKRKLEALGYQVVLCPTFSGPAWKSCFERVTKQWELEISHSKQGVLRILQYAGIFGLIASGSLTICTLLLTRDYPEPVADDLYKQMALAVGAAVAGSFGINLGRIIFRAATRDSSARMFAWAARGQLLVIVSAVLMVALAQQIKPDLVSSTAGLLIIGVVVALFGERALQSVADQAATVLKLPGTGARAPSDLPLIVGINEDVQIRLAEEGIDSVHSLAMASIPRLHLQTPYQLQTLCDWQDQALLIMYVGSNAQNFRSQLMIRGATDAQMFAEELLRRLHQYEPTTPKTAPEGAATPVGSAPHAALETWEASGNPFAASLHQLNKHELEDIIKTLGWSSMSQARVMLGTLIGKEDIRRLRIYLRSSLQLAPPPPTA